MRILSSRIRSISIDRASHRLSATVHLLVTLGGQEHAVAIRTSAPITAPGGAPLKDRLTASAKLVFAMQSDETTLPDADVIRPAA